MNTNDVAEEMLGKVDLSSGVKADGPDDTRLHEDLGAGMLMRGYCTNCGSYPEFPLESVLVLGSIGGFTPPSEPTTKHYLAVNSCEVCGLEVKPSVELK